MFYARIPLVTNTPCIYGYGTPHTSTAPILNIMKNPNRFYSIDTLLNKTDLDGNKPAIYCVSGNRSAGKTTSINRHLLDNWFNGTYREVMYLVRWQNDIDGYTETILSPSFIAEFYPNVEYGSIEKERIDKSFWHIKIDGKSYGWIISVNSADKVKRLSSRFNTVDCIFYDEFLPETGNYCTNEIEKFKSIIISVSRGIGEQSRYVPIIMASNLVSVYNPYYLAWDIADRIQQDTRFLRGHGIVFEQNVNKSAQSEQASSSFLRAFSADSNAYYTGDAVYLLDNTVLIDKPRGAIPIINIKHKSKVYGISYCNSTGCYYITKNPSDVLTIACTVEDVDGDTPYIDKYTPMFAQAFKRGNFRFADQECKHIGFRYVARLTTWR